MGTMHAAVVTTFDEPPHYQLFEVPKPATGSETLVDVLAVGLHPRVRSGAAGSHYTSTATLPMIPGIDGVGRRSDGTLVYFVAGDSAIGTMAEKAVIDPHRAIDLPEGIDVAKVAAAMNPAMSSWVALRRRVPLASGQSVLILAATGNAGTMAVQIAKQLGAGRVVAAGRDRDRLNALTAIGADEIVQLTDGPAGAEQALATAAADVDIVIDYLWSRPAQRTMAALLEARDDRSRPLDWIQIGAIAGPTIELPSVLLRSANLRIQGVGQGAISPAVYRDELPSLAAEISAGAISVDARTAPLADVEQIWTAPQTPGRRTVFIP